MHLTGREGRSPYNSSDLDMTKLGRFAKRVANETPTPANKKITHPTLKVDVTVPIEKTRSVGVFRRRLETYTTSEIRQVPAEVGPEHWLLFSTNWWIETSGQGKETQYNESNEWILSKDGSLLFVWRWQETTFSPTWAFSARTEADVTVSTMTEDRVLQLDYAHPGVSRRVRGAKYWGNREPGKLIRHAPGVGLSLALRKLLPTSSQKPLA